MVISVWYIWFVFCGSWNLYHLSVLNCDNTNSCAIPPKSINLASKLNQNHDNQWTWTYKVCQNHVQLIHSLESEIWSLLKSLVVNTPSDRRLDHHSPAARDDLCEFHDIVQKSSHIEVKHTFSSCSNRISKQQTDTVLSLLRTIVFWKHTYRLHTKTTEILFKIFEIPSSIWRMSSRLENNPYDIK